MYLTNIDTIIFDLHGTIYENSKAITGVNTTLKKLRKAGFKMNFVTNTDGRSIKDVYNNILKKNITEINYEEVFTPVSAVKEFIKNNIKKSFYPLVHNDVYPDLENIRTDNEFPDYIIIGDFCDKVSYNEINKVFKMIKNGAEIIALSKTLWYFDEKGYNINTGSFVRMFELACDKEAILMGKPSKEFFYLALEKSNSLAKNTIVVGDDITTDIVGANKINSIGVLVKTGMFDERILQKSEVKPNFIIQNINELPDLFK